MAETANFTYDGNAVINMGGGSAPQGQVEVLSVQHLIPISIKAKINGVETAIGAYVDYTDKSVTVPSSEYTQIMGNFKSETGLTVEKFAKAVQSFLSNRVEQQMAEAEEAQTRVAQENYRMAQEARTRAVAAAHEAQEQDDE